MLKRLILAAAMLAAIAACSPAGGSSAPSTDTDASLAPIESPAESMAPSESASTAP